MYSVQAVAKVHKHLIIQFHKPVALQTSGKCLFSKVHADMYVLTGLCYFSFLVLYKYAVSCPVSSGAHLLVVIDWVYR